MAIYSIRASIPHHFANFHISILLTHPNKPSKQYTKTRSIVPTSSQHYCPPLSYSSSSSGQYDDDVPKKNPPRGDGCDPLPATMWSPAAQQQPSHKACNNTAASHNLTRFHFVKQSPKANRAKVHFVIKNIIISIQSPAAVIRERRGPGRADGRWGELLCENTYTR